MGLMRAARLGDKVQGPIKCISSLVNPINALGIPEIDGWRKQLR